MKLEKNIQYLPESERSQYISLKEAAALTSYSSDYIGQLIRAGKIEGHQVYTSVSWVTTEEAVRTYMNDHGKNDITTPVSSMVHIDTYFTYVLYGVILCLMCILVLMCYIFFVSIDHAVTDRYVHNFDIHSYEKK